MQPKMRTVRLIHDQDLMPRVHRIRHGLHIG